MNTDYFALLKNEKEKSILVEDAITAAYLLSNEYTEELLNIYVYETSKRKNIIEIENFKITKIASIQKDIKNMLHLEFENRTQIINTELEGKNTIYISFKQVQDILHKENISMKLLKDNINHIKDIQEQNSNNTTSITTFLNDIIHHRFKNQNESNIHSNIIIISLKACQREEINSREFIEEMEIFSRENLVKIFYEVYTSLRSVHSYSNPRCSQEYYSNNVTFSLNTAKKSILPSNFNPARVILLDLLTKHSTYSKQLVRNYIDLLESHGFFSYISNTHNTDKIKEMIIKILNIISDNDLQIIGIHSIGERKTLLAVFSSIINTITPISYSISPLRASIEEQPCSPQVNFSVPIIKEYKVLNIKTSTLKGLFEYCLQNKLSELSSIDHCMSECRHRMRQLDKCLLSIWTRISATSNYSSGKFFRNCQHSVNSRTTNICSNDRHIDWEYIWRNAYREDLRVEAMWERTMLTIRERAKSELHVCVDDIPNDPFNIFQIDINNASYDDFNKYNIISERIKVINNKLNYS